MLNFIKNPFKKQGPIAPRKSAQKELEAQKDVVEQKDTQTQQKPRPQATREHKKDKKSEASSTNLEAGYGVILRPHVSEKTAKAGTYDTYSFVVATDTNKIEIRKAFSKMYGAEPISVQVANVSARATNFRRIAGVKSGWKKAYIRVPKGSNITVYEGV